MTRLKAGPHSILDLTEQTILIRLLNIGWTIRCADLLRFPHDYNILSLITMMQCLYHLYSYVTCKLCLQTVEFIDKLPVSSYISLNCLCSALLLMPLTYVVFISPSVFLYVSYTHIHTPHFVPDMPSHAENTRGAFFNPGTKTAKCNNLGQKCWHLKMSLAFRLLQLQLKWTQTTDRGKERPLHRQTDPFHWLFSSLSSLLFFLFYFPIFILHYSI